MVSVLFCTLNFPLQLRYPKPILAQPQVFDTNRGCLEYCLVRLYYFPTNVSSLPHCDVKRLRSSMEHLHDTPDIQKWVSNFYGSAITVFVELSDWSSNLCCVYEGIPQVLYFYYLNKETVELHIRQQNIFLVLFKRASTLCRW